VKEPDLLPEDVDALAPTPGETIQRPTPEVATLEHRQEGIRQRLALALLIVYGITLVGIGLAIWAGQVQPGETKELLVLVLTSQSTLLGSALGYYFGRTAGQG
jgi:membrane protein YqaA with SNARE-associated domain